MCTTKLCSVAGAAVVVVLRLLVGVAGVGGAALVCSGVTGRGLRRTAS
jgi:hypothetical protein